MIQPTLHQFGIQGPLGSDNKYIKEYKDTHKVFGAILGKGLRVYVTNEALLIHIPAPHAHRTGFVIALRTNHAYNQKSEGTYA